MKNPRTIFLATDFSPLSEAGAAVALSLARRTGAKLHVVHVLGPIVPAYPHGLVSANLKAIDRRRRDDARAKLEPIAAEGITITREICEGIPAREIVDAAERAKADLIVIASHGYGPIRRAVFGSVAAALIRISKVPVLVVGEERKNVDFEVVVAAVDLSPISSEVLELARTYSAPSGVVHTISFIEPTIVMMDDLLPYYPTPADRERLIGERAAAVRALLPDAEGPVVRVDALAKAPAAAGILETAELLQADLVVVGTSGHNAWHRAFIGSSATRVLAEAKCPVLVVPAKRDER